MLFRSQLDGSGSTDVDGDPLTFRWSLQSAPSGSTAVLSSTSSVKPTFTADKPGTYVAQLIVNDGHIDSNPSTVNISTNNVQAPSANAGQDQTVVHGSLVTLTGSGTDPQALPLTYLWSLSTRPPNSNATLSDHTASRPTFVADRPGNYVAQLIVNNGYRSSTPDTVTITTTNTAPVANAGPNQTVAVGVTVTLNGTGSSDADGDPLTYSWSLLNRPGGSSAVLSNATTRWPTFFADATGTYVAQLIVNDGFAPSDPATVTITAHAMNITLAPNPLDMFNAPATLTVGIGSPAPAGGLLVSLSNLNTAVATLPNSVLIPENAIGANVTVTPVAVGTTMIMASAAGYQPATGTINVATPAITVELASPTIGLSRTVSGTVRINAPAPAPGTSVMLSASPGGRVTVSPATVVIPAGGNTGTFSVTGVAEGSVTITCSSPGYTSGSASGEVRTLGAITLASGVTVGPGQSATLGVSLVTAAPAGGVTIALSSGDTSKVTVTPSVVIPEGSTTPSTPAQVTGVAFGSATITASAPGFAGDSERVDVAAALSFQPATTSVGAGGSQSLTLRLSVAAPAGGLPVTLTSNNEAVVTVPATANIPAAATSTSIVVTGVAGGTARITATAGVPEIASGSADITVTSSGSLILPNVSVPVGQTAAFPIQLSAPAPPGGVSVTLTSSDAAKVRISPGSVSIAAGAFSPSPQPQVEGVSWGSATIRAVAPGFGIATRTVQATGALGFTQSSLSLNARETRNLNLTVSVAAPAGGLAVNISASPGGIVTVPASVMVPAGGTTVAVAVTGAAAGTTTVRASAAGFSDATAEVNVAASPDIILPAGVAVAPGESVPFPVRLANPAPAPVFITLESSDPSKATLTTSMLLVSEGQTTPTATPRINGISSGTVTITATANGYQPANATVTVGLALSFQPASIEIIGTETRQLTLLLSGPAPGGGLTVNLSSGNTAAATVPGSVVIGAGSSSASVAVTGVAPGAAVITATSGSASSATANVTVVAPGSISLPAGLSVPLAGNVEFPVVLSRAAPAGGINVTLSSSDTARVTISPASVFIAAGQTSPATQPQVHGVNVGSANISAQAAGYTTASRAVQVHATLVWVPSSITVPAGGTQNAMLRLTVSAPQAGLTATLASPNPNIAWSQGEISFHPDGSEFTQVAVTIHGVAPGNATIRASGLNIPETTLNVTVTGSLTITTPSPLPAGQTGSAYSTTLQAGGGTEPYTWALTSGTLPTGLTLNPATGAIGGTPTALATNTPLTFRVTDSSTPAQTATKDFTLTVTPPVLTITTDSLPNGQQNVAYSATLAATGGQGTFTWSLTSGTLPDGLSLNAGTGVVGGVPSATVVNRALTFTVTDSANPPHTATKNLTLTIEPPSVTITTATPLPDGQVGTPYSLTLGATGGTPPYTWLLTSGTLPAGLSLNGTTGAITGTPTAAAANTPLTFRVTDAATPARTATKSFTLTIADAPLPAIVLPTNLVVAPGESVTFPVTLSRPAASALFVTLASSDTGRATLSTYTLVIGEGQTAPNSQPRLNGIAAGSATISATAVGYSTASVTVTVGMALSFQPATLAITGTEARTIGLMLSSPAPGSGLTVNLNSNNTNVARVPASIQIGPGASSTSVTVTGVGPGSAVITASAADISPATATVTVTAPGNISIPANVSVPLAGSVPFTIGLSTPAPAGGVTVHLSSNDTGKATVSPQDVFIAAGDTAPASQPQVHGVNVGAAVISASAPGYSGASETVQVFGTFVWIPASITLPAGATQNVLLKLTVSAPAAGLSATMTSTNPSIAWTQGTVFFHPDGSEYTQVAVTVNAGAVPGTATIKASGINIPEVSLTVTVTGPLTVVTASLPSGQTGSAYSATLEAGGGTGPYTWALTSGTLPGGLQLNATTGAISGTPTAVVNNTPLTFRVTDASSPAQTASRNLTLTVTAPPLSITTQSLPNAQQGVPYSATLAATGGVQPFGWSLTSGTLPDGLTLNATTGTISGTPTAAAANVPLGFTVTDSATPPDSAVRNLTLTVSESALAIATDALASGQVGQAYSQQMTATGGTPSYTWAVTSGTLPGGLVLNPGSGLINGNPTEPVTNRALTFRVTDSAVPAHTVNKTLNLTIAPAPLVITTEVLPAGKVGEPYAATLAAGGGIGPNTWAVASGVLPAGLGLNTSTGAITGTPTAAVASVAITFRVTDSSTPAQSVTKVINMAVEALPLSIPGLSLPAGQAGQPYSFALTATGGTPPLTWALIGGTLPNGMTFDGATGQLGGTPTVPATNLSLTFRVQDAGTPQQSATRALTLNIAAAPLAITTASLNNGQQGIPYSQTLAASGGTPGFTWSVVTGPLPGGLSLTSAGVLSGTPTATVTNAPVTLGVRDSGDPMQLATKSFTITILPPGPGILTTSLPDGRVGVAYSATLSGAGGVQPYRWEIASGSLPGGLSLNATTGAITGNPNTAVTNTPLTIRLTDGSTPAQTATANLTLTILPPLLEITTASLPDGIVGTGYSQTLGATGGTGTRTWALTAGTLPGGLALNANTGAISGTPTAPAAAVSLTFRVTDSGTPTPQTATRILTLTIAQVLSITTASLPDGRVGTPYSQALAAAGGTGTLTWALTAGTLPGGLSFSAGTISGTPTAAVAGVSLTFRVTDSGAPAQTATRVLTLSTVQPLSVTTASLPDGKVGTVYTQTLAAVGGTAPLTWALTSGALPGGLALNANTGAISGTPTEAVAGRSLTFTVTDSGNPVQTATRVLTLTIAQPLAITTESLPDGVVGASYSQTLAATGGTGTRTWALTAGSLPAGLTFVPATATISGNPTTATPGATLTFTVTDSGVPPQTATKILSLRIAPPLEITTASLPDGVVDTAYSQTLSATGGTAPLTWALTAGTLPAGLTFAAGVISGTPTEAVQSVSLTFRVTDSGAPAQSSIRTLTLRISPRPPVITTASLPDGQATIAYSATLQGNYGTPPYNWTLTSGVLPAGLSLGANTGTISGTPTAEVVNTPLTFTLTDSGSPAQTATRALTLTIKPKPPVITTSLLFSGKVGDPYAQTLAAEGGVPPYLWSLAGGVLPAGLTLTTGGVLSGTPTVFTDPNVVLTFRVTDSSTPAQTATRALTLSIVPDDLEIVTVELPQGVVGTPYAASLTAAGGKPPYTWSLTSGTLPPGLEFDGPTGIISGTPNMPANVNLTFRVQDSSAMPQVISKVLPMVVTYTPPPVAVISVSSATVGQHLQAPIVISLSQAVPAGGVNISLSSSNTSLVKLASRVFDLGSDAPLVVPLTQGTTEFFIYAQAFANAGSVTVTASAPGYQNGTSTVALAPSGFVLDGPNGVGAAFTRNQGQTATLTVRPARLDAGLNFVQPQAIRAGYSTSVTLDNSNVNIGTISPPSLSFSGGVDSAVTTFTASTVSTGTGTITAAPPAGFSTPAAGANALSVTVFPGGLVSCNATVGYKLQTTCSIRLNGVTPSDLNLVLQSSDPGRLLLSRDPNTTGSSSITMLVPRGYNASQEFYVQGLAKTGTATYSAAMDGFGTINSTVTFTPSGFVIKGPFGMGANFFTTSGAANSNIEVYPARLSSTYHYVEPQSIAGGVSASVNVTSSAPGVGAITTSPLTIANGAFLALTQFNPAAPGDTTLAVSGPADFNASLEYASLVASVRSPNLSCDEGLVVGRNLQQASSILIGEPAPAGGVPVTVTSNSSSLRVAGSETAAGAGSVTVTIPAGQTSTIFYVHGLGSSGAPTFSCSAPGYPSSTRTVNLMPSGVVIAGMFGLGFPHWPSLAAGPSPLTISTAILDPASSAFLVKQPLAGGLSIPVSLTNSNPGAGTVPVTATLLGGTENTAVTFTPLVANTSTIVGVTQPPNFTQPSNYTTVAVQVQP